VAKAGTARKKAEKEVVPEPVRVPVVEINEPPLPDLDRIIHERMRLGIVSALAANHSLTFNDLKRILNTSDGNVSVHARKLEEAKYVICNKSFDGRMPKTEYKLTAAGRRALEKYLDHMESIIQAMRERG